MSHEPSAKSILQMSTLLTASVSPTVSHFTSGNDRSCRSGNSDSWKVVFGSFGAQKIFVIDKFTLINAIVRRLFLIKILLDKLTSPYLVMYHLQEPILL